MHLKVVIIAAVFLILATVAATPAGAADAMPGPIYAEVVSVYDGDSFKARARIWPGHSIETTVRIAGLDTPEKRARCPAEAEAADRAADALVTLLEAGQAVLYEVRHGKYAGRVLARVETLDGRDAGQEIIASGLGRAYDGGKRAGWCGAKAAAR